MSNSLLEENPLFREIETRLGEAGLVGGGVLVAHSGGADSTALVHLCAHALARGLLSRLEVAHMDHNLRPESGGDADFCETLAGALTLPFHRKTLAPQALAAGAGNLQAAARRARQEFFRQCLDARGVDAVALAHHADDQAETVLFRLLRGVGPRGAAGMRVWSPPWFRPLLNVRGEELARLCRERGWSHREDGSNLSPKYTRNRIRRELLVLAEELVPGGSGALCRFAALMADDDDLLTQLTHGRMAALAAAEPEGLRLPVAGLLGEPPALRRRLFLAAMARVGGAPGHLDARALAEVEALLGEGRPQRRAPMGGEVVVCRAYEDLWFLARARYEGETDLGLARRMLRVGRPEEAGEDDLVLPLPPGRPVGEVCLRLRRDGDRLDPALGAVKIKDLLMAARVPRWRRRWALVVEDGRGILGLFAPGAALGAGRAATGAAALLSQSWWKGDRCG